MTHANEVAAPLPLVIENQGDDLDGIKRAQAGDTQAFERLYHQHVGRIHALCLRMTANATRAEELTQKAFLNAWQKMALFRNESAFSSWLHRVAVNVVLADRRAEHRRTQRVFGTADPAAFEVPSRPTEMGIRHDLEGAIAGLPPQAREIFVLHDVEGWKHEEIADQLGIAPGTSKAQLHRARKLLQEALQ